MPKYNRMRLELLSLPENVGIARLALASFASQLEFTLGDLEEIKVAVSEAVSNAIIHGYGSDVGVIVLTAAYEDKLLSVSVEDEGSGIADIELARQPSYTTDPERMGLGFVFIESFMDKVQIVSERGRGTKITMTKECGESSGREK
ncbi:MAG: anti-sigma F factor [bacterium]